MDDLTRVDGKHLRKLQNKLNGLFISPESAPEFYDYMNQPKFKLTTYDQREAEIRKLVDYVNTLDGVDGADGFWQAVRDQNFRELQQMNPGLDLRELQQMDAGSKKSKKSQKSKKSKKSKTSKKAKRSKTSKKAKRSKTSRRMRRKTR